MRIAIAALAFLGCAQPDPGPTWEPPPDQPPGTWYCEKDSDCPGQVCARDGSCQNAADLYAAHVNWTLKGQPASAQTCSAVPSLELQFDQGDAYGFGFAPVPCAEGKFSIDKLPTWYTRIDLYGVDDPGGGTSGVISPSSGAVTVDLQY